MIFKKENKIFGNINYAIIGIFLFILMGAIPVKYYRFLLVLIIPAITSPIVLKKFNVKTKDELKENYKKILFVFLLEIMVIIQIIFLGDIRIPYLFSPLNNFFFWEMFLGIIFNGLWQIKTINKNSVKIYIFLCYSLIFLFQILLKYVTIKEAI